MDINAKMLALAILASVSMGATLVFDNAEATEVDASNLAPSSSIQSSSQNINTLFKNVSGINKRLDKLDKHLSEDQVTADLKKQVVELENSVRDSKKESFDRASNSLNNLINLTSLVVTVVGLLLALVAIFGFRSIKEMRKEIKEDMESQALSHQNTIKQNIKNESSILHDEINDELNVLATKISTLDVAVRQIANHENPGLIETQPNQPKSKDNAFDDN